MEAKFGKETPLIVSWGNAHNYLGMTMGFGKSGTVIVHMSEYIKIILLHAPKDMDRTATAPTTSHLFKVNEHDPKCLPANRKELYVYLVVQGLYLSQCGHPNTHAAISFSAVI